MEEFMKIFYMGFGQYQSKFSKFCFRASDALQKADPGFLGKEEVSLVANMIPVIDIAYLNG
jgi:hypothetical protein